MVATMCTGKDHTTRKKEKPRNDVKGVSAVTSEPKV